MQLSNNQLYLLANCAIAAAYQAGHLISRYSQESIAVEKKEAGQSLASQVVTKVDHLSQEIILDSLLPSCKIFDLGLLAEESHDDHSRLEKDFFWSIDPLDGTIAFIDSCPGYAVSIALVSKSGIPQIGVVYDPLEGTLYHAIKGMGVFRNTKVWSLKPVNSPQNKHLTLVNDRSFKQHSHYAQILKALEVVAQDMGLSGVKSILHGGAAMNACWVLENSPACYFKFPKPQQGGGSLWDYSATACIFNEIQASVSNIQGTALELDRADSSFMNQQGIIYASDRYLAEQIQAIYQNLVNK